MKKLLFAAIALSGLLVACNNKEKSDQTDLPQDPQPDISTVEGQRDSLLTLIGDISQNISEVNRMENVLVREDFSETPDQKREIMANIAALKQTLEERRKALETLEAKLKESNGYSAQLKKTIDSQKQLIEEQSQKIQQLQNQLEAANVRIAGLTENVDSLSSQVTEVTAQREAETRRAEAANDELNTCYYACGSNKELKEHKIIDKKFLGKTKIMEGDYDRDYFTRADKRSLLQVKTFAKKAKLLTNHPAGSYEFVADGGLQVLKITNSKKFWEKSNFMVIQTD